jgi:CO/xanthine dehydrogenase Mo-binding subunit
VSVVGSPLVRSDARDKVTGRAVYGVDVEVAGMLTAVVLRSPVPAGRIRRLDLDAVRRAPGVHAAIAAPDVPDIRHGLVIKDQPLFADDVVRFEGEPIAALAADTPAAAAAALAAAELEIEPLEPVVDLDAAVLPMSRLVHEDVAGYAIRADPFPRGGNVAAEMRSDPPGVDEAFERADHVVEDEFRSGRQYQAYLEPRVVVAEHDDGRYTLHVSHQFPFHVRDRVAEALNLAPDDVRVVGHHIGGGFGAKLDLGLEAHAALLARASGRPVKLLLTRPEDLLTCPSRENAIVRVRTAVSGDGDLLARELEVLLDAGAYAVDAPYLASLPLILAKGAYRVGPTRVRARAVYTNTTPTGAFRGVSGTYLVFALERHLDRIARELGTDRRRLRLRNLMRDGDTLPNGQVLPDASILREAFEAVEAIAPWSDDPVGPAARRRAVQSGPRPDAPLRGVGIAATFWMTNPLPGTATVRLEDDGGFGVVTAATENGSGAVAMGVTQIVAEELGVRPQDVRVTMPDTSSAGYDAGSQGSRTTHIVGRAARTAAHEVRQRLLRRAADLLEAAVADLEVVDGEVGVRGAPVTRRPLAEIAKAAQEAGDPIVASGTYSTPTPAHDPTCASGLLFPTFPTPTYHVHLAEVAIDPVTGVVTVVRYVVAQEVGRAINPVGVIGQVQGGVAQGLGYALYEGLAIGADGRYRQRTLESYRLPVAPDVPEVEVVLLEHPDPEGPFGAKGVAEPPIVPVAAAIANAVADATGGDITVVPITPEAVLDAIHGMGA